MALREIRELGDEILREVKELTPRIKELIEDMLDTMYEANGVGLAAPQVGVLRRIAVIDVTGAVDTDDEVIEDGGPFVLINPVITLKEGEQCGEEGCLSYPGMAAEVKRPEHVIVKAFDIEMEEYELEAHGLLARAICHETDHLDGIMYTDVAEGPAHKISIDNPEEGETE